MLHITNLYIFQSTKNIFFISFFLIGVFSKKAHNKFRSTMLTKSLIWIYLSINLNYICKILAANFCEQKSYYTLSKLLHVNYIQICRLMVVLISINIIIGNSTLFMFVWLWKKNWHYGIYKCMYSYIFLDLRLLHVLKTLQW